jgi:4-amino-4-deoxy-L-arabinose transferase-like glycosyltransferase
VCSGHDGGIVASVRREKGKAAVSVGLLGTGVIVVTAGVATTHMLVMALGVVAIVAGWLAAAGMDVRPQR